MKLNTFIAPPGREMPLPYWVVQAPRDTAKPQRATFYLIEFVADASGRPILSGRGREVAPPFHAGLAQYLGICVDGGRTAVRSEAAAFLVECDGYKLADHRVLRTIGVGRECHGCRERMERALARVRKAEAGA